MSEDDKKKGGNQQGGGQSDTAQYEDMGVDKALRKLNTDPDKGLSNEEAKKRLDDYGANEIKEKKESTWKKIFKYFWGPIPWMLEIAVILSAIKGFIDGRWEDLIVIAFLLLLNAGVGYWHERKAGKAIDALKKELALKAQVIRGGSESKIDSKQLVPGDIVVLDIGNVCPADAMVLEDQHMSMDESGLTGESMPAEKGGGDLIYSSTPVKRGGGKAVVVATGLKTKFAKTVALVAGAEQISHFQKAVMRIGYFLIGLTGVLVVAAVIYSIFSGANTWLQIMMLALGLTLAGIPAALPAVLSITMSVGAGRLAKQKAVVSHLPAMEEMAGLEVLCTDKTGTLTLNQLKLQEPVLIETNDKDELMIAAGLTVKDRKGGEDPIDNAVMEAVDPKQLDGYDTIEFRPFDPTIKRAEADVKKGKEKFTVAKGEPEVLANEVDPTPALKKKILDQIEQLAKDGFRALGVAKKKGGKWKYLGLLPLLDPPRPDAAEVVKEAQDHGIDVRMITGDHPAIGRQVAGQLGIGTNIIKAGDVFGKGEIAPDQPVPARIRQQVIQADGFGEVAPEHKFMIIKAFQQGDRIVGMTGDGVNDAPALHAADVGIAVAGAKDAARAAADLVLTAQGLGVIINGIEEARRIFERMTSYATFRIVETLRLLFFVTLSVFIFGRYPLTALMIILLAVLNDIPIITIAWDNTQVAKRPVRWHMARTITISVVLGIVCVLGSFLAFIYVRDPQWFASGTLPGLGSMTYNQIESFMFLQVLVAGGMTLYVTRSMGRWFFQRPWPKWELLAAVEGVEIIGSFLAIYGWLMTPIGWIPALWAWGYSLVWMIILDLFMWVTTWAWDRTSRYAKGRTGISHRRDEFFQQIENRLDAIHETLSENHELLQKIAKQRQGGSRKKA